MLTKKSKNQKEKLKTFLNEEVEKTEEMQNQADRNEWISKWREGANLAVKWDKWVVWNNGDDRLISGRTTYPREQNRKNNIRGEAWADTHFWHLFTLIKVLWHLWVGWTPHDALCLSQRGDE